MTLIIDGDHIIYKTAFVLERDYGLLSQAESLIKDLLKHYLDFTGATSYIGYLGGESNFRHEVANRRVDGYTVVNYKSNRGTKPIFAQDIKQILQERFDFHVVDNLEADDACAITQTYFLKNLLSCAILSTDKDLLQVQGVHFQVKPDSRQIEQINVAYPGVLQLISQNGKHKLFGTGDMLLASQLLMGDSADTYSGVPGIGPVKAVKLLENQPLEKVRDIVTEEYKKAYGRYASEVYQIMFELAYLKRSSTDFSIPPLIPKSRIIDG